MAKYTFLHLAEEVLLTSVNSMTPQEIWDAGKQSALENSVRCRTNLNSRR